MASGATCVQRLDGSRDSAIHTKYRISLRSSSMQEPRYPLPRVIMYHVSRHHRRSTVSGPTGRTDRIFVPWRIQRRGLCSGRRGTQCAPLLPKGRPWCRTPRAIPVYSNRFTSWSACKASTMILPQVHLRKPCYDFSFL
jgi:hypothetical protein